jgi:hypothetical protein
MRLLRNLILGIASLVLILISLTYITGNDHLVRGVRYTYLIGRKGPEIDDRDFFPYATIPADDPQPWPQGERYGKLALTAEESES